ATVGIWRPLVLATGGLTMVAGGLRALRQHDLKLLVAFGTVSQLGLLMVLFGIGTPAATSAGCVMLLAHAVFKAALFMSVGTVDHHAGTRDLRTIPDLRAGWGPFIVVTSICAASMAGLPLLVGFIAKEAAFESVQHAPFSANGVVLAVIVAGSTLTVAYTARLLWGMFASTARRDTPASEEPVERPAGLLVGPIAVLAAVTLVLGVAPSSIDRLVGTATRSLTSTSNGHVALWHGVNLALVLSAIAIVGGLALFAARRTVAPVLRAGSRVPDGGRVFTGALRWTNTAATRVTAVTQNGSLPIYAGVTLLTAALAPGIVLAINASWPGLPGFAENPAQLLLAGAVLSAALAAAITRRRFSAAVFLGATGYSMAGLFVVQGAPDLALTQAAIETLSTVLFVLVLRRLPDRFERTSTDRRRVLRLAVSATVGVTVFVFAIIARASRTAAPVSDGMIQQSLPEAHGRNVVNVILVDIRGFDTLGEITVLASAAIGAVALARAGQGRRRRRAEAAPEMTP
ncbi:MAG: hydrogen gas-evolving membrane-bound hydrogenase subunit E, partial [Ilumatobacteraceae bacterium]